MENPKTTPETTLSQDALKSEKMQPFALLRGAFCQMRDEATAAHTVALARVATAREEGLSEDDLLMLQTAADRAEQDIRKARALYAEVINRMQTLAWPIIHSMPRPI